MIVLTNTKLKRKQDFQGQGKRIKAILQQGEPAEKCVHIYPGGKWNNAFCKQSRGYICSGPPPEKSIEYQLVIYLQPKLLAYRNH